MDSDSEIFFYKDRERGLKTYRQKRKAANNLIKEHKNERKNAVDANQNPDEIDFGLFQKDEIKSV